MKSRVSKISRFLAAFVYLSSLSSVSYFATTENQILHAYKDWTGLISTDDSIISSADISSGDVLSSEDISKDMYDMAVSNDTEIPSDDSFDSFVSNDTPASSDIYDDSFVSHDTNDTEGDTEADTEDSAENTGNTVAPVASSPDGKSEDAKSEAGDGGSESIAVLTTRLTADHHLIATLSISGIMGADVAVFPSVTGHSQENNNNAAPDSNGGNIYTVSNTAGSSAGSYPAVASDDIDNVNNADKNVDKPDSLLLNFENEEGVVESVRLWLDNEIDETVILDGITASNDKSNSSGSSADFSSRAYDGTGSNGSNNSQSDLPRLAVPLSEAASSDLAANTDTAPVLGHTLDSFIGLDQLASPVIVILPSTNEQYYFADGRALAAYDRFDQEYRVLEVRATTRAEIEVRLVRK